MTGKTPSSASWSYDEGGCCKAWPYRGASTTTRIYDHPIFDTALAIYPPPSCAALYACLQKYGKKWAQIARHVLPYRGRTSVRSRWTFLQARISLLSFCALVRWSQFIQPAKWARSTITSALGASKAFSSTTVATDESTTAHEPFDRQPLLGTAAKQLQRLTVLGHPGVSRGGRGAG